jgi:hypothetical protein
MVRIGHLTSNETFTRWLIFICDKTSKSGKLPAHLKNGLLNRFN